MGTSTPDVVLVPCADYDPALCRQALEQAVAAAGGLDWIRPGMRIGIKANLVAMMKPETAATTHPELLKALVDMIKSSATAPAACIRRFMSTESITPPACSPPARS